MTGVSSLDRPVPQSRSFRTAALTALASLLVLGALGLFPAAASATFTAAYLRSFGGEGSGAGHLAYPVGVATDSEGNVWVADFGHNRVQEFNSKGEFKLQFGDTGTGNGQFSSIHAIAVSPAGNVYVADASRIEEFNSKGEYVRKWGKTGTENGQFEELRGVATDPEGHVWTLEAGISGTYKPRLQEFSPAGTYTSKFEFTSGSENGQLKEPQGLAIDSKGNVWIADTSNSRIEEFNSKGEYQRKTGSEGTGNGQFKKPYGIATDSEGNVWVADTGNDRVQKFSSTGTYISQFGKAGDNNGQFSEPLGIATDSKGNVWVADSGNDRVEEIASSEYVRQVGGEGSGPGQLSAPYGVATDSEGNVWVADSAHDRIQEFNSKGEFKLQFGGTGKGNGQFSFIHAIAVSSAGNVYVADASRIEEFNSKGEYVRKWGTAGTENGQFEELRGVAIDPEGHIWTLEAGNSYSKYKPRLQEFSAEGTYTSKFEFAEGSENGQLKEPQGLAIDSKGNVWIADTSNSRIQEFNSKGEYQRKTGSEGTGNGQFKKPRGIAVDSSGDVWVADTGNNRIQELSSTGTYISQFGKAGDNNGQFSEPWGLTIDSKGNVWVADTGNDRVEEIAAGEYVRQFGGEDSGPGQLSAPAGVATDSEGNVWVADTAHSRIQEFNSKGEFVLQFGAKGSVNGLFNSPRGIAIDSKGNVWIADSGNNRIEEFNSKGEYLRKFGSSGTGNGQFGRLQGVAIDPEGHVWTVEGGTEGTGKPRVQEFSAEGTYISQFGAEGTENGQFKEPQGIAIDSKGNVWIADSANKRIQEFNPKGEFVRKTGSEGTGNGQFKNPKGIATDSEGNVWVADTGNNRVQEFSAEGTYISQFGNGGGDSNGQFSEPKGIATDSKGDIWVADTGNNRAQGWSYGDPPTVATKAATEITQSEATLNATVNPERLETTYQFEYTTEEEFKEHGYAGAVKVPATPKDIGSGTSAVEVSQHLKGLELGSTYRFRISAENAQGAVTGEEKTLKTESALPERIESNTTLKPAGSPYTGKSVTIASGVTLTVKPGVTIQVSKLTAEGTLNAEGTSESPIVFTSAEDSAPGQWEGITLSSSSSSLKHDEVRYATTAVKVSAGDAPTISELTIRHSSGTAISLTDSAAKVTHNTLKSNQSGIGAFGGGSPEITENTIEGCASGEYGILYKDEGEVGGEVNIHGNLVEGCGASGTSPRLPSGYAAISVYGAAGREVIGGSLAENTVRDGGRPIDYDVDPLTATIPANISENTLSSNEANGIWLAGRVDKSTTWKDEGYPIVPRSGYKLDVASGAALTLEPGLALKAEENAEVTVAGELLAQGTAIKPITITSIKDDSVGGDTNGDGSKTTPAPGDWAGIAFTEGSKESAPGRGTLEYVNMRYGGATPSCKSCEEGGPMLDFKPRRGGPTATASVLAHSTLEDAKGEALAGRHVSTEVIANTFSSDAEGISFTSGGSPEIAENTVKDCATGDSGISYRAGNESTGEVRIHGNVVERCGVPESSPLDPESSAGIEVFQENVIIDIRTEGSEEEEALENIKGVTLSGNTVREAGRPISYHVDNGNIPGDILHNSLSKNTSEAIWLSGNISESVTWENPGFPIVTGTEGGSLFVEEGAKLTLDPGIILKAETHTPIQVFGELIAAGTSSEPVAVTSIKDDSVGGDTNGDGGASSPGPGDWEDINVFGGDYYEEGGRVELDHLKARYGGGGCGGCKEVGMLNFDAPSEGVAGAARSKVKNSEFSHAKNYALGVGGGKGSFREGKLPSIEWSKFTHNSAALVNDDSESIKIPHNEFGGASGPKPYGSGEEVLGPVDPRPWTNPPGAHAHCQGKKTQCPKGADPISLATGQLDYSHRDLLLSNKSEQPLEFTRTYNSGDPTDTGLGPGWAQTGLISASEQESGDILIIRPDGRQDLFTKTESGYEAPSGVTDKLVKNEDGTFTLTTLGRTAYEFDQSGRIATITDEHGLVTTYGYDSNGRLATITDPSSQSLTFSYNASNHITKVTDSTGREVSFTYNEAGDLASATDAMGEVTKYGYNSEDRLTTITDPRGDVILKNTYDEQGRIVEQEDGTGGVWTVEYKPSETIVTEPKGGESHYGFDSEDRIVSETNQLGDTTTYSYDSQGNIDEVQRPGGAKWSLGYDSAGNLTSSTDPEGGKRHYTYDEQNRLTSYTDPRGGTWNYEWSEGNDLMKIVNPEEGETSFTYNEAGEPLSVTDPDGHTSEYEYDGRGNMLSATDPLGHETSFEYDARNYLTAKAEPGLKAETFSRDAYGDMLSKTTPEGHETEYEYDPNGLLISATEPGEHVWQIERNAMERPVVYTDPLGHETAVSYDGDLNPISVTNRRGKTTSYKYNVANELTGVEEPEGQSWEFGYDVRGNRDSVTEPRGNTTTYKYDLLDHLTEADEPLSTVTEYGYDPEGDLTSITEPRGNTTALKYDPLGRLIKIEQPLSEETSFTYDPAGNRLTQSTAAGTLHYAYDAANRLKEVSQEGTTLRAFGYDKANRLTSATDAEGKTIEAGYDEDGLLTSLNDGRGQTVSREYDARGNLISQEDGRGTISYAYNALNRMTSLTDPQGHKTEFAYDPEGELTEAQLPNGITTTNSYNDDGRLAETASKKGASTIESLAYGYDAAGNITSKVNRLSEETTYAYNALDRLTEFNPPGPGSTGYEYDAAGNRTKAGSVTYSFNALNQLTEASNGTTYTYDGAGRLIKKKDGSVTTTYGWDPLNELTSVNDGSHEVTYSYDALGRRSVRKESSATQVAHYGDLTDVPTLDTDAEGHLTSSYVQGPAGLLEERSEGATNYPLADAHGDITTITNAEGEALSRQSYDPWGVQLSGPQQEMGYLGAQERPTDPTSGLIQMGERPYAPELGAFASEDPLLGQPGVGATLDRYPYAWDNPLNRYDLSGRDVCSTAGEVPLIGPALEGGCHIITYRPPGQKTPLEEAEELGDRAAEFLKAHAQQLAEGCVVGTLGGLGIFNLATGGTPIFVPGIGWITEGVAAGGGCIIGAAGKSLIGINPLTTR